MYIDEIVQTAKKVFDSNVKPALENKEDFLVKMKMGNLIFFLNQHRNELVKSFWSRALGRREKY